MPRTGIPSDSAFSESALEAIAELVTRFPLSADMLSKYLTDQIPIRVLGYYQRVAESAVQYAERLLSDRPVGEGRTAQEVAFHMVNHYKDHGFVIDFDEATGILGHSFVKINTAHYKLADEIYKLLSSVERICYIHDRYFWIVGTHKSGFVMRERVRD